MRVRSPLLYPTQRQDSRCLAVAVQTPSNLPHFQSFLPSPQPSTASRPFNLHQTLRPPPELPAASNLLQTSIPTRPPDLQTSPPYLQNLHTSRSPDLCG